MKGLLDWLKSTLGEKILAMLLSQFLTKENIIKGVDTLLDYAEDLAAKTATDIDDKALKLIREALNIPDDDKPIA